MRIGLFLGDLLARPLDEVLSGIRDAASEGFASAWLPQITGYDALTVLALAGHETPGIELGTAVVPTYPRHPVMLAGQALTVQAATGGRLALGIGVSHEVVIEGSYGFSFERPARHMREYLSVLMPLVRGEQVNYTGETMKGVGKLGMPPAPPPQVLLAALAPAMLRLAGRLADGTVTWMVGPKTLKGFTSPTITAAAEKAGRSEAPRIVAGFPVSVSDDAAGSKERAARTFAMYDTLPSYKNMLDREGYGGPADIAILGDEDAVAEQVLALAQCGVTEALCSVFGSREEKARTRALLGRLVGQAA
jgi:5,10-methylenetetrahydromethanopterin reductase